MKSEPVLRHPSTGHSDLSQFCTDTQITTHFRLMLPTPRQRRLPFSSSNKCLILSLFFFFSKTVINFKLPFSLYSQNVLCTQTASVCQGQADITWSYCTESLCLQYAQISGWFKEKNISQTICFTELMNQFRWSRRASGRVGRAACPGMISPAFITGRVGSQGDPKGTALGSRQHFLSAAYSLPFPVDLWTPFQTTFNPATSKFCLVMLGC